MKTDMTQHSFIFAMGQITEIISQWSTFPQSEKQVRIQRVINLIEAALEGYPKDPPVRASISFVTESFPREEAEQKKELGYALEHLHLGLEHWSQFGNPPV